jgi:nucleotide-binding universal stress UspA family protein
MEVVVGDPDEVLVEQAGRRAADLVVLGAVGHRLPERLLLGSVAARTARESPVPVLVVRDSTPLVAWLEGQRPLMVVAGYERGESAESALRWAAHLTRVGPIDLTVVQLVVPDVENRRLHVSGPGAAIALSQESLRQLREELRLAVAPLIGDLPARLTVKPALGRTDIPLVEEAQKAAADLIVVGSHQRKGFQRWWHGSVSSGVLHAAPMSVAVVPYRPAEH